MSIIQAMEENVDIPGESICSKSTSLVLNKFRYNGPFIVELRLEMH